MLLAACLFVAALAQEETVYAPHVEEASEEGAATMAGFELADGIQVELFAAEPMLANPVCFYVDHRGDFYVGETFRHYAGVTDMRDHMDWLDEDLASQTVEDRVAMIRRHEGDNFDPGYGTDHERLRLIRDTDGDGRADTAVVFADGFKDHAAGIGAGVLAYQGDVYYTCIPDLWLLRDTDGDGVADERSKLSTGYGVNIALLGHDLHGLRIGPDRRLYFSSGDRGFHVQTENGVLSSPKTGAVLRCNLDGTGLEIWHSGLRNPQELVFDDHGNLWTGDNNSDGGDEARWVNVVEGGDSGWRYPYQWITAPVQRGPWNDEKLWHPPHAGQAAYVLPPVANLANGPSGLAYYPGTGLSQEYAGHFFLCDFRGDPTFSGIHTFTVKPQGAFWELGSVDRFVWNTLVTDCDFGPDGALYFTDWVAGWNKTGKGRIYKAFLPAGSTSDPALETAAFLRQGMQQRHLDELVVLIGHLDQRVRQEAQFELVDRGPDGLRMLTGLAASADVLLARLHAIWGLGIAGRTDPAALEPLIGLARDPEPEVRAQAMRVLGDERHAPAAEMIYERLADDAPRVRFCAALAAARLGEAMPAGTVELLAIQLQLTKDGDPNLRHALTMALLCCASAEQLVRLSGHDSPHVQMAVLLVRRRNADPQVAQFLASPDPRLVLEAVRAIHDVPIPGAMPFLASLELPPGASAALARRVINANNRLGQAEPLAALALREDLDEALRVEALDVLSDWAAPSARDRVVNFWRPLAPRDSGPLAEITPRLAAAGIGAGPDELVRAFTRLAVAAGSVELSPMLVEWTEGTERASGVRVSALLALLELQAPELPRVVRAALGDPDGNLRAAALTALERLAPGEALPSLPPILAQGELLERRAGYRILARSEDPRAAGMLSGELDKYAADLLPAELALDLVLAVEDHADPTLVQRLETRRALRQVDPLLAPYLDSLFGGDADSGRAVFRRVDLSCVRCHKTEDAGARQIGPDLAGVSRRLSRLQILESIKAPNRRTTPGYSATVLFLKSGAIVNGRIVEDTAEVIRVLNTDGEILEVDPLEVAERRADLSAMPEDMLDGLTRRELRDLLEYVASL